MECDPPLKVEVLYVALELLRFAVPRVVLPFLKVTVPVAPVVTVAVKVTELPYVDGFREEVRVVELDLSANA